MKKRIEKLSRTERAVLLRFDGGVDADGKILGKPPVTLHQARRYARWAGIKGQTAFLRKLVDRGALACNDCNEWWITNFGTSVLLRGEWT